MKKKFIECGKIVSTHGIRGEMKALCWTDDTKFLLNFSVFYLENGKKELNVKSSRVHKKMLLLTVEGVNTIEKANLYRGQVLYIDREDDTENTPFAQDYIGVEVFDIDTGQNYGKITEILITGANDVFVLVDAQNIQRLVPDIPPVIIETNLEAMTMKIKPLKGLFDL